MVILKNIKKLVADIFLKLALSIIPMYMYLYSSSAMLVRLSTIFGSCQSQATGSMNRLASTSGTPATPPSARRKLILNWQLSSLRSLHTHNTYSHLTLH